MKAFIQKWANKHCKHQDVPGVSFWVVCDRPMVSASQLNAALATIDMLMQREVEER